MKNKLIVFEGIDGVGKSTICKLLKDSLVKRGFKAVLYEDLEEKNKGFNLIKSFIKKQVSINSSFLFYIASAIYKSEQIEKLSKYNFIICDRYIYSTLAYHAIRKADKFFISNINKISIRSPDFLFLLKVNDNIRLKRIKNRRINNADDFKVKTDRNFIGKMEKELEKFNPIIIDNSNSSLGDVIKRILKIVLGS